MFVPHPHRKVCEAIVRRQKAWVEETLGDAEEEEEEEEEDGEGGGGEGNRNLFVVTKSRPTSVARRVDGEVAFCRSNAL